MVNLFSLIALLFAPFHSIAADSNVDFRVEFTKPEIYVGEQVMCNFVIYTPDEVLDVEVAKFPEFRGYWKENLALRQGPISGMMTPGSREFKVVVGTYLVVPMLTRRESAIEPMKIVATNPSTRKVEGSSPPEFVLSKGELPKVLELPPITNEEDKKVFNGAVGQLTFYQGDTSIKYQRGEPALFRFVLTGQGNFPELNDLPLFLPPTMELISKRALTQGSGQFAAKSFEYTVNIKDDKDFSLPAFRYVYFDPNLRKYASIQTPSLQFQFIKTAEPTEGSQTRTPVLELPQQKWTNRRPIQRALWFVMINAFLAIAVILVVGGRTFHLLRQRRQRDPKFQAKKKLIVALESLRAGHELEFLKLADELAAESIGRRLGVPGAHSFTRTQLVQEARRRGLAELALCAEPIFEAYQNKAFSPIQSPATSHTELVGGLTKLVQA
jgi:hypothetical protein